MGSYGTGTLRPPNTCDYDSSLRQLPSHNVRSILSHTVSRSIFLPNFIGALAGFGIWAFLSLDEDVALLHFS